MPDPLGPSRTAVLLMDYQNGIIERFAGTDPELLDRAAAVPASNKAFAAAAARGSMGVDDPATAVADAIAPQAEDIVVRKKRVGAFSTVRDAADRDYRVVLIEDLCVDSDEEVHRVLLGTVFHRQADVITSDRLAVLLSRRTA